MSPRRRLARSVPLKPAVRPPQRRQARARPTAPRQRLASPSLIFGLCAGVMAIVCLAAARACGLTALPAYLVAVNVTTFALYAYDKQVAGGHHLRVPEAVLHTLALLGGTVAAWLGQRLLRHKTIKASFRRVGLEIVALQLTLLLAWLWYRALQG